MEYEVHVARAWAACSTVDPTHPMPYIRPSSITDSRRSGLSLTSLYEPCIKLSLFDPVFPRTSASIYKPTPSTIESTTYTGPTSLVDYASRPRPSHFSNSTLPDTPEPTRVYPNSLGTYVAYEYEQRPLLLRTEDRKSWLLRRHSPPTTATIHEQIIPIPFNRSTICLCSCCSETHAKTAKGEGR